MIVGKGKMPGEEVFPAERFETVKLSYYGFPGADWPFSDRQAWPPRSPDGLGASAP